MNSSSNVTSNWGAVREWHPVVQALCGGLFTWALTALGAATVFLCVSKNNKKLLDFCLGLAAGVMTAASFWSLLAPAIAEAEAQFYGKMFAWAPVAVGFALGAGFVFVADHLVSYLGLQPPHDLAEMIAASGTHAHTNLGVQVSEMGVPIGHHSSALSEREEHSISHKHVAGWRRVLLLVVAITTHNIPEGLAVGVAFAAASQGQSSGATFVSAVTLALGIGIQNFPEGMAVSLPLLGYGYSRGKAFLYGQLSGLVEPIAAVVGALLLVVAAPVLPYALAFGAGAMLCVVYDDIVPEGHQNGNGRLTSVGAIVGFIIMMVLDVATGDL